MVTARAVWKENWMMVQKELARVTDSVERLKGRLRFLKDRLAFSTITLLFQPRPRETLDEPQAYKLPFPWLNRLGLPTLLDLR